MKILAGFARHLDLIGQFDLADEIDRILMADSISGTQPSMQLLPGTMTTMRGPAGEAIVRDEMERGITIEEEDSKQVKEKKPRKEKKRKPGLSIGLDVRLNSEPSK